MTTADISFPPAAPPEDVDVLIVGGGPVGLSAAVELTGRGVQVAVVEAAETALLVRAGAMGHSPRTVEHFRRWDLLQSIRTAWTFPPEWNRGIRLITSLGGHELVPQRDRDFRQESPRRFSLAEPIRRPQTALQSVFLDRLAREGVVVAGGHRVEALRQDADGVETTLADGRVIRSRYVLGADGGRSTVRRLAGIEREGEHAPEKHYRLVVRTGDISDRVGAAPSGTNLVFNQRASGFLAAISPREWRVYSEPYPLDAEPDEAELLATARAAFGFDLDLEIASATVFYRATRIAETFRRGRVLLAGDAAHVRTPGGNLGEGFGDVTNLGWKLAAVLAGHGGDALLDSYDQERRPHNWRIAGHALEQSRRTREAIDAIRAIGVPDDADTSPAATDKRAEIGDLLAARRGGADNQPGVVFDERYDASAVIWYDENQLVDEQPWEPGHYEDDPRPGHRAPDGYIDPWGDTLFDRIGTGFALLVLTDDRRVEQEFTTEAAARSLPFTVVHLSEDRIRAVYGGGNILVRPDQHVAWRGTSLPPGGAAAVLDLVLGQSSPADAVGDSRAARTGLVEAGHS